MSNALDVTNILCMPTLLGGGGYSGVENIAEMWMNHYKDLYNSVNDSQSKNLVCQRIESMTQKHNVFPCLPCISVLNIFDACRRQKCGKAVGSDGILWKRLYMGALDNMYISVCCLIFF
jgi:hypothetical protein